jgi:hypothetical protein
MPAIFHAIGDEFKSRPSQKDTERVNTYEGFQANGAIVGNRAILPGELFGSVR